MSIAGDQHAGKSKQHIRGAASQPQAICNSSRVGTLQPLALMWLAFPDAMTEGRDEQGGHAQAYPEIGSRKAGRAAKELMEMTLRTG